ncbi:MAG: biopolymer transporter ExbD [Alphaproteobacteria bacterium]|nr:biopolymer transporter ExbD [Alphaproteobacteria bacterium]MCB9792930.1 biopolymer transporter ExbD [Alphaproteobacteria bacterium]
MGFKMDKGGGGAESDINVTPLIDIVLVLLIIFMVITPRTIEEMSANLPSKSKSSNPKPPTTEPLVVAAYDNGDVALNLKVLEKRELHDELRARLRAREKKVVFVDAHPNLNYGSVVEVMDLVRDAGADRVGLARLKDEGPDRAAEGGAAEGAAAPASGGETP